MNKKKALVIWFKDLRIEDVPLVGGKNAALGEMYAALTPLGVNVPNGFALAAEAYRQFLKATGLAKEISSRLRGLNTHKLKDLQATGRAVRQAVLQASLPESLQEVVLKAYHQLGKMYGKNTDVAVRSSATAEDLPGASFAGQQETYLNVVGEKELLLAVKRCIASLFTDRAISYRKDKGFSHFDVALSVGVQKMVRSDMASSGVAFTLDTETGFEDVIMINGSYGLGENIVQGKVTPDEFIVWKPGLREGKAAILARDRGEKKMKMVYSKTGIKEVEVPPADRRRFCLEDEEVLRLADWCLKIEEHFSKKHGRKQPMDVEWAKDGKSGEMYIVQARPETVHSSEDKNVVREYRLGRPGKLLLTGAAVGTKIASGKVRVLKGAKQINNFQKGEVLVTKITDPDWEPIMKIAAAIVTDKGGRTSHAAIVSREIGIPCVVGTNDASRKLRTGAEVTVDCSSGEEGKIYVGKLPFKVLSRKLRAIPETKTKVMVNIGSPQEAFRAHYLPVRGVGLGRLEFIIASNIGIHPNALLQYPRLKKDRSPATRALVKQIEERAAGYGRPDEYYVSELTEGIAKIGAAFYPHEVIIRFSDFKTNEYRTLLGGEFYEPEEENPMLGWRGASRYYDPRFEDAFGLECKSLKKVREEIGLTNVVPMVPFCRTPEEGKKVVKLMAKYGLVREKETLRQAQGDIKSLKIYVMCEIPSNVIQADEFLDIFDGMSIGSNDLTQLALGLDRDSGFGGKIGNESEATVKRLIAEVIMKCKMRDKYIGICGQAPSDLPGFAEFLVAQGISSISLNPDSVLKTIPRIEAAEKRRKSA